jgi:hypothetical protein
VSIIRKRNVICTVPYFWSEIVTVMDGGYKCTTLDLGMNYCCCCGLAQQEGDVYKVIRGRDFALSPSQFLPSARTLR